MVKLRRIAQLERLLIKASKIIFLKKLLFINLNYYLFYLQTILLKMA